MASDPIGNQQAPQDFQASGTSLGLLARARGNDSAAWERLMSLYRPLVASWCRRSGANEADVGDIVQDIFTAVAVHLNEFQHGGRDGTGGTFRGWLRVITRNKLRDHFRRASGQTDAIGGSTARMRIEQLADPLDEESDTDSEEMSDVLSRALQLVKNEFELRTWDAFWLTTVENRAIADVATSLKVTSGVVRNSRYKVLRRLREELGDVVEWPWGLHDKRS